MELAAFEAPLAVFIDLGERQSEDYRSWIRQNSECTEFFRIQLRIMICSLPPLVLTHEAEGSRELSRADAIWQLFSLSGLFDLLCFQNNAKRCDAFVLLHRLDQFSGIGIDLCQILHGNY